MSGAPALLGVPYDASSSFLRGAALAPPLIRAALHSPAGNAWTEGRHDLSAPGAYFDAGDLLLHADSDDRARIEAGVVALMEAGYRPLLLGGDHSITYPAMRALRRRHVRLSILHIDAHADLYDQFEGDRYSHASPFARIMEEGLADHLVQIGIRTLTGHQAEQAARFGVEIIEMREWTAGRRATVEPPVYVSLDLDALDPAFAPGVSHREPGGLTVREVLSVFDTLPEPPIGADVVEFNPTRDVAGLTAGVAAKLVKELLGAMTVKD